LDELRSLYEDFIFRFEGRAMRTGEEYMAAQIELLQAWRKFPFLDPGLPPRFLPKGWPGIRAADLFRRCYERWGPPSRQHWQRIASADSAGSAGRAMTRS
jgi:phenylacetic acid degradation operon negative regulatory protein